ncbi:hypothetical protein [Parasphingorhabdus sp.]|uniref:hypothetical protein n=1 Tax=Parasphingorhabdus sp. TaxID=2709688 RepID=UPI002F920F64
MPDHLYRPPAADGVRSAVNEHSGAYGMGVDYAYTVFHKAEERVKHGVRLAPVAVGSVAAAAE